MSPEKQREAIAIVDGWRRREQDGSSMARFYPWRHDGRGEDAAEGAIPDYLNDLDAIQSVVRSRLLNTQRDEFLNHLTLIVQRPTRMATITWLMVTASAAQHVEAVLRTLKLWKSES